MLSIHLLGQLSPFGKQAIMHGPILALGAGTSCRRRRIDPSPLVASREISIHKSHLPCVDVSSLNPRPCLLKKLQTISACKIGVFNQRHGCIGLPPHSHIRFEGIPGCDRERPQEGAAREHQRQPWSRRPLHELRTTPAFFLSSNPIISNGQTTVASLRTSANRPPSFGVTNFPHESPS